MASTERPGSRRSTALATDIAGYQFGKWEVSKTGQHITPDVPPVVPRLCLPHERWYLLLDPFLEVRAYCGTKGEFGDGIAEGGGLSEVRVQYRRWILATP